MFTRCRLVLLLAASLLIVPASLAQGGDGFAFDDYGSFGDPGYSVYGDTGPYPSGDEPLPAWDGVPSQSAPGGRGSISSHGDNLPTWDPVFPPSTSGGGFSVSSSGNNTATGDPFGHFAARQPPELWAARTDPEIDGPMKKLSPDMPIELRSQYRDLLQQQRQLNDEVYGHPLQNAAELMNDLFGALGGVKGPSFRAGSPVPSDEGGADEIPYGERIHRSAGDLGDVQQRLAELNRQYRVPDLVPLTRDPEFDPAIADRYSVYASDGAPKAVGQRPPSMNGFDLQSLFQLNTQDILPGFDVSSSSLGAGPAAAAFGGDPGGIDFGSVRWVFLSERDVARPGAWEYKTLSVGLQSVNARGGPRVRFADGSRVAADALVAFLTIPDRDLWVNLHPQQPDRIIPASLARTDVGRIMLLADLQLKRDAGRLMREEPFASAERRLVDSILVHNRVVRPERVAWGSGGRVEIASATSRVFARQSARGVVIEGVVLDAIFEQKAFKVSATVGGVERDLPVSPVEWRQFVALTQRIIRPRLVRRVNRAAEYEPLREAFSARVLADWYKRTHRDAGALARLVDSPALQPVRRRVAWTPREIWLDYKRDYDHGAVRSFGGVSFDRMPEFRSLTADPPAVLPLVLAAFRHPGGEVVRSVYRTGASLVAASTPSHYRFVARWALALAMLLMVTVGVLARVRNTWTR